MIIEQCQGFIDTPPLWKDKQFGIKQFEFPEVSIQSSTIKPIIDGIRLGHQMEYVFKQLIECSEQYEILLYNLQIIKEKQTLGEIDFVLKDVLRNRLIHVELTYKFYIIDPEVVDPIHRLIGPNRRDAFFMKMAKIKNKQIPLLHSQTGIEALSEQNINHLELEHQCCFKAQLFQPYDLRETDIGSLNKDCCVGYWIRFESFKNPNFISSQYYIPSKSEWVIAPSDQVIWKPYLEIIEDVVAIIARENAPMLWKKCSDGTFEKFFIVYW